MMLQGERKISSQTEGGLRSISRSCIKRWIPNGSPQVISDFLADGCVFNQSFDEERGHLAASMVTEGTAGFCSRPLLFANELWFRQTLV